MKHFSSPIWTRIRAFVSASSRACNRMRRSAAYGKANHLGSIVFNKLPPKQMMKVASTKFAKLIQLCVMAILAFTPFSVVDTVVAYPESIPHFPGDRWDPEWTERDVWGPDIWSQANFSE